MKPKTILSYCLVQLLIIGVNFEYLHGQTGLFEEIVNLDNPEFDSAWIDRSIRSGSNQPALRTEQHPWAPTGEPTVRVAYLIPSNRSPQPMGAAGLKYVMTVTRDFFKDQMIHNGLEPKTISYETESDGVTPLIHVINIPETDVEIRQNMWSNTINAAISQSVPLWEDNELWLLIPEAHLMLPDGSIEGWTALGLGFGSANDPGVAVLGSTTLTLLAKGMISDNRSYDGIIIPEIGPFPLKQNVSFPWFEGATFSTVISSHLGAFLHELGHTLGLDHDGRNDQNAYGNLMGNGLRGIRGYLFPELYPTNYTRLAYSNAQVLNTSHYFNSAQVRNQVDEMNVESSEVVKGQLVLGINVSDVDGLSLLKLVAGGESVSFTGNIAERRLFGVTSFNGTLTTPYFDPGVLTDFWLQIYDLQGNRLQHRLKFTPPVVNRAPNPYVSITPPIGSNEDLFTLDASQSMDPDGDTPLSYAWDFMDDGDYIPGSATSEQRFLPGNHLVRVKVTDNQGNYAFSSPIGLHVSGSTAPPQLPENIEWIRQFGTGEPDIIEVIEGIVTYGGAVYAVGTTEGSLPGQTHAGGADGFIRKYENNGTVAWTHQFGSSGDDFARGVSADASGVYVVGETETSYAEDEAFLHKYDANGNEIWTRQFGTEWWDGARGVSVDGNGVYVAGYTEGVLPGQSNFGNLGDPDAFVRKYDTNGNEIWTRQFGTSTPDGAQAISVLGSEVYVTGYTEGELSPSPNPNLIRDAFVRRYDDNGNEVWTQQFGLGWLRFQASGISVNSSGVYVCGSGQPAAEEEFIGIWRRYDSSGRVVNDFQFDEGSIAHGISVAGSGVYVTWSSDLITSGFYVGKFDVDGSEVWTNNLGYIGLFATEISAVASDIFVGGGALPGQILDESSVFVAKIVDTESYEVLDIDYCNPDEAPFYNFYWTEMKLVKPGAEFFSQNETHALTFTEFEDGTALIQGNTQSGSCSAQLYIVLKDVKNWAEWRADGGVFKPHGCDPGSLEEEGLRYYVIDGDKSTISVTGGDCLEEGTFIVTQRPDPNDPNTGNLGVHVGPGGALFDSDPSAQGLAGWAWMGPEGDERRWEIDFNFHIQDGNDLDNNREEVCDGFDNNGDGQIDEDLNCEEISSTVQEVTQTIITPYPTLFDNQLNLRIEIPYGAVSQVQIFDLHMRLVMDKKDLTVLPGKNDLSIDMAGLAPNMYILLLNTGKEEFKMKIFAK